MRVAFGFVNGVVFTLALLVAAAYVGVRVGALPAGADQKPPYLEHWAAKTSLHATLERETKNLSSPLQPDDANVGAGIKLYAANCSVCHGAADAQPSNVAAGLYVRAPQLAKDGVEDDDEAETFWKIDHGIRFTGMPSFAKTLSGEDEWRIAMFLKRMDALPPSLEGVWRAVPSARTHS